MQKDFLYLDKNTIFDFAQNRFFHVHSDLKYENFTKISWEKDPDPKRSVR